MIGLISTGDWSHDDDDDDACIARHSICSLIIDFKWNHENNKLLNANDGANAFLAYSRSKFLFDDL